MTDSLLAAIERLLDNDETGSVRARLWDFVEEEARA